MRKTVRKTGVISLCLVLCVYATLTAAPPTLAGGPLIGGISVKGRVLINGSEVVSEAAFFPGSRFATERGAVAEISLGGLGRVRCLEESAGAVNFGEGAFTGSLDTGIIHVSKPRGVAAVVATRDGSVVAGEAEEAVFIVNVTGGNTLVKARLGEVELRAGKTTTVVKQGETGTAGTQQTPPRDDDDDDDTDGLFWFGVVGYLAIVTAAIIYAVTRDEDGQGAPGPPTVIDPSPVR